MSPKARKHAALDGQTLLLAKEHFQQLLDLLWKAGYRVLGPTIDQEAVVYDEIRAVDDLPRGWTDEQSGGKYRLKRRHDDAWFGYAVGPQSWKRFLFPPNITVAEARRDENGWQLSDVADNEPPYAFIGMRACELAAVGVQDRTFINGTYVDPVYRRRRERALFIAVNCTQAASTCFCTSMNTGPRCTLGFDLALTELPEAFTIEIGSPRRGPHRPIANRPGQGEGVETGRSRAAAGRRSDHEAARHDRHSRPVVRQPGSPALVGGGHPLLIVHQLHDGLPDLLLQLGEGGQRP